MRRGKTNLELLKDVSKVAKSRKLATKLLRERKMFGNASGSAALLEASSQLRAPKLPNDGILNPRLIFFKENRIQTTKVDNFEENTILCLFVR